MASRRFDRQESAKSGDGEMLDTLGDLGGKACDLVHGAAYALLQRPLDAAHQLVEHAGLGVGEFELISKPDANSRWSNVGQFVGNLGLMVGLSLGVRSACGKILGSSARSWGVLEAGTSGVVYELLQPESPGETSFAWAKLRDCSIGFATFASMAGTEKGLSRLGAFGRSGSRTFLDGVMSHGLTGAVGGVVQADVTSLFTDGHLASFSQRFDTARSFATFSMMFGGAQRLIFKEPGLTSVSSNAENMISSEEYLTKHYEQGPAIGSRFLSWIAETRPQLRPKNWLQLKESGKVAEGLEFGAWEPADRVRVLQELRRLANTELASDSSIDEFLRIVGRSSQPLEVYSAAETSREAAYERWDTAHKQLDEIIKADPTLRWGKLWDDQLLNSRADVKAAHKTWMENDRAYNAADKAADEAQKSALTSIEQGFNAIGEQVGLPKVKVQIAGLGAAEYSNGRIGISTPVLHDGPTSSFFDLGFHEYIHHRQGTFTLGAMRKMLGAILKRDPLTRMLETAHDLRAVEDIERLLSEEPDTKVLLSKLVRMTRARDLIFKNSDDLGAALIFGPGTPLTASAREQLASLVPELRSKAKDGKYQAWLSYAGSQAERQAWAGGTLTRIRATMAGFPGPNKPLPGIAEVMRGCAEVRNRC